MEECAKKVARKLGLQLIELHYNLMPENSEANQFADFGPADFLAYIKNAEIVISNSFHGTVFSVIYRRPFYSVYKKNGRVDNLLEFLQISEKHVSSAEEIDEILKERRKNWRPREPKYRKGVLR